MIADWRKDMTSPSPKGVEVEISRMRVSLCPGAIGKRSWWTQQHYRGSLKITSNRQPSIRTFNQNEIVLKIVYQNLLSFEQDQIKRKRIAGPVKQWGHKGLTLW